MLRKDSRPTGGRDSGRPSRWSVRVSDGESRGGGLPAAACDVLATPDAAAKARAARALAAGWRAGTIGAGGRADPPVRPARPERPALRPPSAMPRRRKARSPAARTALLHALAHIELNAIDLACDMIARFADPVRAGMAPPGAFFDDWVRVADEEGKHFLLLEARLAALGAAYGDLPAHDGLWQAAESTAGDLLARLAVVPMVLEARGLDVTPGMIANLEAAGDSESADVLRIIHDEEIGHVAAGVRWFRHVAELRGIDPETGWRALVRRHYRGPLKPPFNADSRARAGLPPDLYEPLAG